MTEQIEQHRRQKDATERDVGVPNASAAGLRFGAVHRVDCREALAELPSDSVQCVVTSPPYWGLRKYDVPDLVWDAGPSWPGGPPCEHWFGADLPPSHPGPGNRRESALRSCGLTNPMYHANKPNTPQTAGSFCRICGAWLGQLGLEPTIDLYLRHIVVIFREVRRTLREEGTLWINIGDCYASSSTYNTSNTMHTVNGWKQDVDHRPSAGVPRGCKPKDLVGVPWAVAFALRDDGWFLRAEIIWHKTSPMPESVCDRPTRAHEQLFMLSKSSLYFYNKDEATNRSTGRIGSAADFCRGSKDADVPGHAMRQHRTNRKHTVDNGVSNWRDVWTIGPDPNNAQHYAPFPRELARRCIVAGSRVDDVVLDPFAGTGTTVRVADGLGRKSIGFDLGKRYVEQANELMGVVRPEDAQHLQQVGLFSRWKHD